MHHYCVQIAPGEVATPAADQRGPVFIGTRSMIMQPADNKYLEMFLEGYRGCGAYSLIPAVIGASEPKFMFELSIMKHQLSVKAAADVAEHDIESLALRVQGMKLAS